MDQERSGTNCGWQRYRGCQWYSGFRHTRYLSITYSATDTAGNEAEPVVRTIRVVDQDAPVITLLGDANITHGAGCPGARWNDSVDGNGGDANGTVNSQVPGTYLITYTYTDSSGNSAVPVTRTIQVEDTTPPVITDWG